MRIITDIPLTMGFIKQILGYGCRQNDTRLINAICTDSREIKENDLFIPLRGETYDAELFLDDVKKIGAYTMSAKNKIADIRVPDTSAALLKIAAAYKKLLNVKKTVAITGSVGKSTTKNLTFNFLKSKYKVHATEGNLNNEIGVPFTVLSAQRDTEILVIEAGMNHQGELARISECIIPDIAVITNIGTSHIGNFGTREAIANAKREILLASSPIALIPHGEPLLSGIPRVKTVSTSSQSASYYLLSDYKNGMLRFDFYSEKLVLKEIQTSFVARHISECLAYTLAICAELDFSVEEIFASIDEINRVSTLLEKRAVRFGDFYILDDSYNSSYESIYCAFKTLKAQSGTPCALIGDILELGASAEKIHRHVGMLCADAKLSKLYLLGRFAKDVAYGAMQNGMSKDRIFINENLDFPEITAMQIIENSENDDVILFKASHKMNLSRIASLIEKMQKQKG